MKITEIFNSLEGEGEWQGRRCTFVRLHGCNKDCTYCDEKHEKYTEMTADAVFKKVWKLGCHRIVITGGEPTLQLEELKTLIWGLWYHRMNSTYNHREYVAKVTERPNDIVVYTNGYDLRGLLRWINDNDLPPAPKPLIYYDIKEDEIEKSETIESDVWQRYRWLYRKIVVSDDNFEKFMNLRWPPQIISPMLDGDNKIMITPANLRKVFDRYAEFDPRIQMQQHKILGYK